MEKGGACPCFKAPGWELGERSGHSSFCKNDIYSEFNPLDRLFLYLGGHLSLYGRDTTGELVPATGESRLLTGCDEYQPLSQQ